MGLSTAERNRRKRERKKREKEEQRKVEENQLEIQENTTNESDVVIEYVPEPLQIPDDVVGYEVLRAWQARSVAVVSDDERYSGKNIDQNKVLEHDDDDDIDGSSAGISKRKMREMIRPSIADLKRTVQRPDLVEAHDVTADDPEFLIQLKAVAGTVPVPRHWGRKRKYLQGKRGFEKPPFHLPDFIIKTGITEIRDTVMTDEESMSVRQKNRMRVAPKMGAIDVDYRTLHDAFFKHQTKPCNLTKFGDLYYEGKELETKPTNKKPGEPLSRSLRDALGMTSPSTPPPWLVNMQRYGPPPSWPGIGIPGLNAPLPSAECQYGFHPGGWGKPPIDNYGRPLYGGNPFDPPGSSFKLFTELEMTNLVTSDGKTVGKSEWGALPTGDLEVMDEDESSEDDMEGSSSEDEEELDQDENEDDGIESVVPLLPSRSAVAPINIRKETTGNETPVSSAPPKQLYQVIEQIKTVADPGAVFASEVSYVIPGSLQLAATVPDGAESVLSKVLPAKNSKITKSKEDDDEEDLGKNFKF